MHKSLYALFGLFLLFVVIGFGFILLKTYRERKVFQQAESNLEDSLVRIKDEVKVKEDYLKRLEGDSDFLEWVGRQRIGYIESDEIIFRFDDVSDNGSLNDLKK